MAGHISKYGNKRSGTGGVSYLSPTICNGIITIMVTKVAQRIMSELNHQHFSQLS